MCFIYLYISIQWNIVVKVILFSENGFKWMRMKMTYAQLHRDVRMKTTKPD